jgi:hypothetical protein
MDRSSLLPSVAIWTWRRRLARLHLVLTNRLQLNVDVIRRIPHRRDHHHRRLTHVNTVTRLSC